MSYAIDTFTTCIGNIFATKTKSVQTKEEDSSFFMLNESSLSTILYRIEHLFDGTMNSTQKSLESNHRNYFHHTTSNDVLPPIGLIDDIANDLDRYLTNDDHPSDSSHTSSPSMPPSTVLLTPSSTVPFEFVLNAPTASLARISEETTTYLNQGQPYEIKFDVNQNSIASDHPLSTTTYRSILRLCFWDKVLQAQERDLMQKWINEYQSATLFDIDMNLTYGILSIISSRQIPNAVEIVWDAATTTSLFLRFKCTSTDFAQKRHGGEKGIPLRIQIDTYYENDDQIKHLHSCCCKIQLFRLKGAQRKNKADQIRIEKLNLDQRRRYQTTLEYTILQSCHVSPLYTLNLLSHSHPSDDLSDVSSQTNLTSVTKKDLENNSKRYQTMDYLSGSSANMNNPTMKITIRSSNEEILTWLKMNNFNSIVNRFEHYTGLDLLRLTLNDLHRICNGDDAISIRLYNQLNETIVAPLKTLFIKTANHEVYSAVYLHTLTRRELLDKLFQLIQQIPHETYQLIFELNKIRIKIDNDNVVKYSLPNHGQFYFKTTSYELTLSLINPV